MTSVFRIFGLRLLAAPFFRPSPVNVGRDDREDDQALQQVHSRSSNAVRRAAAFNRFAPLIAYPALAALVRYGFGVRSHISQKHFKQRL